jgi:hypothetical protein
MSTKLQDYDTLPFRAMPRRPMSQFCFVISVMIVPLAELETKYNTFYIVIIFGNNNNNNNNNNKNNYNNYNNNNNNNMIKYRFFADLLLFC